MRNSIAAGRNYTDIQLNQIMHVHVDTQLDSLPPKGQAAQAALTNKNIVTRFWCLCLTATHIMLLL